MKNSWNLHAILCYRFANRGNLDVAIAKKLQNSHAILCYRFANRGNLDVAIAKKLQNSHAILCDRFGTCSFANFLQWLHLNNLAIAKKNCQWNSRKMVEKIFGQWKSGCTNYLLTFLSIKNVTFTLEKRGLDTFWLAFYSNIWSHWSLIFKYKLS